MAEKHRSRIVRFITERNLVRFFLWAGCALRLLVFAFMDPSNPDDHYSIVRHVYEHGEIPVSGQYLHSFHPPLYYILASFFVGFGGEKAVQVFSLLCSLATLVVLARASQEMSHWSLAGRNVAMALAACCPSFVVFGLYVSNDSPAYLLGALVAWSFTRLVADFRLRHVVAAGVLIGLGLSVKGTFLSFVPVLPLAIVVGARRAGFTLGHAARRCCVALLLVALLGSYKFVENAVHHGRLVVHNMDETELWVDQQPVVRGLKSWGDFGVWKLVKTPVYSESTRYSPALLLYGTMWYKYIWMENNFMGVKGPLLRLGSAIYLVATVPTMLMLVGFATECFAAKREWHRWLGKVAASSVHLLSILAAMSLVVVVGVKFDAWSCFQSRLSYHAFFGLMCCLAAGTDWLLQKAPVFWGDLAIMLSQVTWGLCFAYFILECARLAFPVS